MQICACCSPQVLTSPHGTTCYPAAVLLVHLSLAHFLVSSSNHFTFFFPDPEDLRAAVTTYNRRAITGL
jgi:hypothetical protein